MRTGAEVRGRQDTRWQPLLPAAAAGFTAASHSCWWRHSQWPRQQCQRARAVSGSRGACCAERHTALAAEHSEGIPSRQDLVCPCPYGAYVPVRRHLPADNAGKCKRWEVICIGGQRNPVRGGLDMQDDAELRLLMCRRAAQAPGQGGAGAAGPPPGRAAGRRAAAPGCHAAPGASGRRNRHSSAPAAAAPGSACAAWKAPAASATCRRCRPGIWQCSGCHSSR